MLTPFFTVVPPVLNADFGWSTHAVLRIQASMHTSQHLLSAVLENKLNLPTLAWSLTAWPTPSYVELPRGLTPEEITYTQEECNTLVFEGRSVYIEVEELHDANKVYDTPSVGIPEDYTGGVKRTVIIDGVDRNPYVTTSLPHIPAYTLTVPCPRRCCGTHAPTIHNLQLFILPQTETLARSTASSVRIYFLAGPRLLAHLTSSHALLAATAGIMSCGAPQVTERAQQVVDDRRRATKRVEDLEAELAASVADRLLSSLPDAGAGAGALVRHEHRTDDAGNALGFLSAVTTRFADRVVAEREKGGGTGERAPPFLLVLASSPSAQSAASTTVVLIFGSDDKKVKEVGDELKGKLTIKGGGKGTRWSGKFTGVWKDGREGAVVRGILDSVTAASRRDGRKMS